MVVLGESRDLGQSDWGRVLLHLLVLLLPSC